MKNNKSNPGQNPPVKPEKEIPAKPDPNHDPTRPQPGYEPERNDPTRITQPEIPRPYPQKFDQPFFWAA